MEIDVSPSTVLGGVGGAFGAAGAWLLKLVSGRISKVEASVGKAEKSAADGLDRVERRLGAEINRVERATDESFRDVWDEIAQHRKAAGDFRAQISADIARLPTREELERMIARVATNK